MSKTPKFKDKPSLGFIGQGWVGHNLADHFEDRGFSVVRYALDPEFQTNREAIAKCDIVFIAVPTPTTEYGFDHSALDQALTLVGKGKTAVVRSTMLPGTTDSLVTMFPDRFILHVPEFLREATARFDIDNPDRNIVGIPTRFRFDSEWVSKADLVLSIMPESSHRATYKLICTATEAEMIKHAGNEFLCLKTVFMNLMYDLLQTVGGSWDTVAEAMMADPRIGSSHMFPVHQNGHMGSSDNGRGAGGHCFPKDWSAIRMHYEKVLPKDQAGILMLKAIEVKNIRLLQDSGKDTRILNDIYGENPLTVADLVGGQK